jgi:hypothetical protein
MAGDYRAGIPIACIGRAVACPDWIRTPPDADGGDDPG